MVDLGKVAVLIRHGKTIYEVGSAAYKSIRAALEEEDAETLDRLEADYARREQRRDEEERRLAGPVPGDEEPFEGVTD